MQTCSYYSSLRSSPRIHCEPIRVQGRHLHTYYLSALPSNALHVYHLAMTSTTSKSLYQLPQTLVNPAKGRFRVGAAHLHVIQGTPGAADVDNHHHLPVRNKQRRLLRGLHIHRLSMGFYLSLKRRLENMPRFSRVADYCVPAFLSAYIL